MSKASVLSSAENPFSALYVCVLAKLFLGKDPLICFVANTADQSASLSPASLKSVAMYPQTV